jgi:hypothetical protein
MVCERMTLQLLRRHSDSLHASIWPISQKSHSKIKVIREFSLGADSPIDERYHVREQFRENFGGIK